MPTLTLKPGREKSLLRRHPWIFSGAIARLDGNPTSGETVDLLAADGQFLARAAYSPCSQIRARVWTFDPSEPVDKDFFRRRIKTAIAPRDTRNVTRDTNAFRLIHAESDGLPGLIVDRYADTLVLQ
ncbi:MAG: 23S rRNA (cytosine(1962)-C(5))-methyltransferase RlmI, partial [Chloroflexi bacterium]|nr:23S rRNA (cytosine(1962)-C(5))-methyltransferase RlmI [Chloroflexota bacterium]